MNDRLLTKTEKKLINYIGEKLVLAANGNFETEEEIQALEKLGVAAVKLAEWLEEEQIEIELDEVKCAMICEALGEAVSRNKI